MFNQNLSSVQFLGGKIQILMKYTHEGIQKTRHSNQENKSLLSKVKDLQIGR